MGEIKSFLGSRVAWLRLPGAKQPGLCALENLPRLTAALGIDFSGLVLDPLTPQSAGALKASLTMVEELFKRNEAAEPEQFSGDIAFFVSQWLSYYGPVPRDFVCRCLGLVSGVWTSVLETLLHEDSIVADVFTEGAGEAEVCDRENLERLFVMARRARRPELSPLPAEALPLFLASWQGVVEKGTTMEDLQERLERLFGYISQARLWEEAILPARMEPYYTAWTDSLLQNGGLLWFGRGSRRVGFCFREDLELFPPVKDDPAVEEEESAQALFPDPWGKYDFLALGRYTGLPTDELTLKLWGHLWQGSIANDSLATLRSGILNKFTPFQVESRRGFSRRSGFKRWSASVPYKATGLSCRKMKRAICWTRRRWSKEDSAAVFPLRRPFPRAAPASPRCSGGTFSHAAPHGIFRRNLCRAFLNRSAVCSLLLRKRSVS